MQQQSTSKIIRGVFPPAVPDVPTVQAELCQTCFFPLNGTTHGWVKDYSQHFDHTGHNRKYGYCEVPCPTCTGDANQRALAQEQANLVLRLFRGCDIPPRAKDWTFSTYPIDADQAAKAKVYGFVTEHLSTLDSDRKRALYLGGLSGRCKTSLAISALKVAMQVGGNIGLFVNVPKLLDQLRATYDPASEAKEHKIMEALTGVPWLVLDDLGVEKPTEYAIGRFYLIVNQRLDDGLYTIFTSNLAMRDLAEYWRPKDTPAGAFHPGIRVVQRIAQYAEPVDMMARKRERGEVRP